MLSVSVVDKHNAVLETCFRLLIQESTTSLHILIHKGNPRAVSFSYGSNRKRDIPFFIYYITLTSNLWTSQHQNGAHSTYHMQLKRYTCIEHMHFLTNAFDRRYKHMRYVLYKRIRARAEHTCKLQVNKVNVFQSRVQ